MYNHDETLHHLAPSSRSYTPVPRPRSIPARRSRTSWKHSSASPRPRRRRPKTGSRTPTADRRGRGASRSSDNGVRAPARAVATPLRRTRARDGSLGALALFVALALGQLVVDGAPLLAGDLIVKGSGWPTHVVARAPQQTAPAPRPTHRAQAPPALPRSLYQARPSAWAPTIVRTSTTTV
jgi:hypothetical protein